MALFPTNPEDRVGLATLKIFAKADRFNHWMFQTILPFCQAPILEIGSGIGNISKFFLKAAYPILLTDIREEYCQYLKDNFTDASSMLGIDQINLVDPHFEQHYKAHLGKFKTVYALNVVEHIENDQKALENCYKLLQKDGNLIILVPAYRQLFCDLDQNLGHYRRYTRKKLTKKFTKAGFDIVHHQYFNLAAVGGWFWYGKILKRQVLPEQPIRAYNRLVPIFKVLDWAVGQRLGNSVIVVGKKR